MQKALAFGIRIMHNSGMRSHSQIVRDAGPATVAALTGKPIHTVRSWAQRDSIPAEYWALLVSDQHCTAAELMLAAASKHAA